MLDWVLNANLKFYQKLGGQTFVIFGSVELPKE